MSYYLARDADNDEIGYGLIEIEEKTAVRKSALVMNKWGHAVNAIIEPISESEYKTYACMKIFPVLKPRFRGSMRYYVSPDTE